MVYLGVVIVSNMKILTFSFSFSPLVIFTQVISIGSFFVTWLWVSSFDLGQVEMSFSM
jgi:hypothetical protein